MPSYPAKPYIVPYDDWFNKNTSNFKKKSKAKGIKNISSIHEFFYRQSDIKVGGSENHIKTNLEKKSCTNIFITSLRNSDESFLPTSEEKYSYSQIPSELRSIRKRSFQRKTLYKNFSNNNIFKFRSYLLDLKSVFIKIIRGIKRS